MKAVPGHRSERATLRKLAAWPVFFDLDTSRPRGQPPVAEVGARIAQELSRRAGSDRERAVRDCTREAMRLLGVRSLQAFTADERLAWVRWSPLVALLPGLSRWSDAEKRAMVHVIRAKGARREGDFVELFAAHPKLEQALFSAP